jgi:hypothetical protein
MSLQGVLTDFGVADVFQLIAQQRKTGVLDVERSGRLLEVYFRDGAVVRARPAERRPDASLADFLLRTGVISEPVLADAQRTQEQTLESLPRVLVAASAVRPEVLERVARLVSEETIFELFQWEDGAFRFRPRPVESEEGDRVLGAEQVLLDAMRMCDEWVQMRQHLSDLSATLAPNGDIEQFRMRRASAQSSSGLAGEEIERLFSLCDGRLSARRVIDLSLLGTFRATKGLVALRLEGLLRLEAPVTARFEPEPAPARDRRGWLGGVLLLGTAAVAAVLLLLPAPQRDDHPVPADDVSEARVAAGAERLRFALEVERWLEGSYPASLERVGDPAWGRLAADPAGRYLYARSAGGYTLYGVLP